MWLGHNNRGLSAGAAGGAIQITTSSLPNAVVGTDYQTIASALTATGGSGSYLWSVDSVTPNRHFWFFLSRSGQPYGTPQCDTIGQQYAPDTVVIRCTDAGNSSSSATKSFTVTTTATGGLSILTPTTLPNATKNGGYAYQLLASGGVPPYLHWSKVSSTGSNTWNVTPGGWLEGVPTVNSTDTVTIALRDAGGNSATNVTVSITTNATIQLACIDMVNTYPGAGVAGIVKLPGARAGQKYSHQLFPANGGTGTGQSYALTGSLPAGLSLNTSTGKITGTPTTAGNANCSISVTDSGSNTTTAYPVALNVGVLNQGTKPTANTATGVFYIDTTGKLCDPNTNRFVMRGINRDHYDGTFSGYSTSGCNTVRYTIYETIFRGTNPGSGQTMATYTGDAATQHTNVGQFVVFSQFYIPGTGTQIDSSTSLPDLGKTAAWFCDNVAAYNSSGLHGASAINIANEWGPASASLATAYAAVWDGPVGVGTTWQMPVSTVNTSTGVITLTSTAASNPLAGAAALGYVYFSGGGLNQAIPVSGTGGSSGAWTVTASTPSDVSGWTTGGTISAGAIGMMRAAGYTDPFTVDAGAQFGQQIKILISQGATIAQSDPLANTILAIHCYNNFSNYCSRVSGISKGANATITLADTETFHPLNPQIPGNSGSGYSNVTPNTNTFSGIDGFYVTGVAGMTQINGAAVTAGDNSTTGGPQPTAFTLATTFNTSTFGTYTSGGFVVPDATASAGGLCHIDRVCTVMAGMRGSGVDVLVEEYGPSTASAPTPLLMDALDVIQATEANQMGNIYWALDSSSPFGIVANGSGTYTTPTQLSAPGIDVVLNPRYGIHAMAAPASSFL